jgi:hypothetical protein
MACKKLLERIFMMKKLVIPIALIAVFSAAAFAQSSSKDVSKTGTTVASFLEIPVGAKAVGMGGAFVSISDDVSALYWNASGIASLQQNEVNFVHTNWIAGTKFDFAGVSLAIDGFGALGLSFTSLTMGDMMVRTVDMPEGTGEYFSAGDIAMGISYARQLTDRFAIGITTKYIQETIWHESASGFAVDVGTSFRTDLFGGMIIGASLTNFGSKMQLSGRDTRNFGRVDPTKLGSNDQIPSDLEMNSWNLPLLFQFGVSTNIFKTDEYRWTVAVDALNPSDNYQSVNAGTEIAFMNFLYLRGGYQNLFLAQSEGGLTLGVGISSNALFGNASLVFNYAYRDFGRLESINTFSVGVNF